MDIIERRQLEDFIQQLELYIPDEVQAHKDYTSLSNKARELGFGDAHGKLNGMAQDEWRHKDYLMGIIATIKERLEREQTAPKYPMGSRVMLFGMLGTVVGHMCESGRWRNEVMCTDYEGKLQQNWAWEEDIHPEY